MIKVDRELAREIRATIKSGSDADRRAARIAVKKAIRALSTPDIRNTFSDVLREHGRANVAIAVACTLKARAWRIDNWGLLWAQDVLHNWQPVDYCDYAIMDELHPTRICEYAADLVKMTTIREEDW